MGAIRAGIRLASIGAATAFWYSIWLVTRVLSGGLGRWTHHWIVTRWARTLLRIAGIRVVVDGAPPRAPFFLVANHLSYLDVAVLLTCVDGFFLAKSEIARWPIMGVLARTTGTLFVERGRKSDLKRVNHEVVQVLERGAGVIVFPEGTSSRGAEVLPFRTSIFDVPVRLGSPVVHASLTYAMDVSDPSPDMAVCWWGDMRLVPHLLTLLTLPSIRAGLTFGDEINAGDDRKDLARRSHAAVTRTFVPVSGPVFGPVFGSESPERGGVVSRHAEQRGTAAEVGRVAPVTPTASADSGEPSTSSV